MLSYTQVLKRSFLPVLLFVYTLMLSFTASAQNNNNNYAGVEIDAQNVLKMQTWVDPSLNLRKMNASQGITQDLREFNPARAVSLTRLESEIAKNNGILTDEVRYMAGLQRVDYVFVYPESGDVVLVGPAEGWYKDISGRVVGLTTGKPVLRLEDLVTAMRAYAPGSKAAKVIGCSIDPTQEGLARFQEFQRRIGTTATPNMTEMIVNGSREALGLQKVSVTGVSNQTHFAKVLVEADYRMKLMGIGLEKIPVKNMKSFVASVNPGTVSRNALFRWYFVPDYTRVRMSPDKLAMGLEGKSVKLVGADEMVSSDGSRKEVVVSDSASKKFTQGFTKNYDKIAAAVPVYAELRNLIDLAVVAAFLQETNAYEKLGWELVYFGDEQKFRVETERAPEFVESAVNAIWRGHTLTTPIGGGVEIFAKRALEKENLISDSDETVSQAQKDAPLPENGWWWNK
ncbi:MAG: DUF1598 domain-containing protein [Thermoguttaceae bacterium]